MLETQVPSLGWENPLEEAWQPTPVFLPGRSHGQRSLVNYSPWGHKELDLTERVNTAPSTSPSAGHMHAHHISHIRVPFTRLLNTQGRTLQSFGILWAAFPCPADSTLKAFLALLSLNPHFGWRHLLGSAWTLSLNHDLESRSVAADVLSQCWSHLFPSFWSHCYPFFETQCLDDHRFTCPVAKVIL